MNTSKTNMPLETRTADPRARQNRGWLGLAVLCSIALWGCGDLLTVDNPSQIADRDLDLPEALEPLVAGVAGEFAMAYRYTAINMAMYANEMQHTGSYPSWRVWDVGASARPSSEANGMYNAIARAVWFADNALIRLDKILEHPERRAETAEILMWGGFARFFYADNFCEATFDGGPPVAPAQIYKDAEEKLSRAVTVAKAAGANDIALAAQAGRARARLMQGDFAGAAADAAVIPDGFKYDVIYSNNSSREYNWLASYTRTQFRPEVGVHPLYYQDQRYINDPRTPFTDRGPAFKGVDDLRQFVQQEKFPNRASPIPLTNTAEARLILAEAELKRGNVATAVTIINQLRVAVGLPAYEGPMDQDSVFKQLLFERSAELWLQGQRYLDLYRTNDPFIQTEVVDKCIPIGQTEWDSNPHLGG